MKKHINSLIFNTFSLLQEQPLKILFVFFDAGETKALEPVMQAFERSNISFQILAVGTSTKLLKGHTNAIFIDECDRDRSLDPKIIKELTVPDVVITGTVSEMQRQISQELKIKGAKILAYHDNFSPIKSTDFIAPFFTLANLILVPSENVAKSIHQIDSNIKIEIVGQPTLEHWIEQTEKIDFNKLRNLINLEESKPFLLYIAGYGKGYAESFESFARAVQYVDHLQIRVALHPKMDGKFEAKILNETDCSHVKIIPKEFDISLITALADLIVTWRSTAGVQAAFLGKQVIYLDCKGSTYTSLAIEKGWALQVFNAEDFLRLLVEFEIECISKEHRFVEGGVPDHATQLIYRRILKPKERSFVLRKPLDHNMINLFQKYS